MARDVERTDITALLLVVTFRMALLPSTIDKQALHFEPILAIAPGDGRFHELYNELTHESIIRYVALEPANPASIWSLIKLARENPRALEGRSTRPSTTSATIRAGPSNPPRTKPPNRKESGLKAALLSGCRIAGPDMTRSRAG